MANVLFAGSVEGEIYMWKIPSGECKVFQGFGQKTETATVIADGKQIFDICLCYKKSPKSYKYN